jgi:ferrochelatase
LPRSNVFLANLGTPRSASAEDVESFLREFLGDPLVVDYPPWLWRFVLERLVLRSRPERVAEMYRAIAPDTPLPLVRGTTAIAEALDQTLAGRFRVRAVYRYGQPSLATELAAALARNEECIVVPLFPQRTSASSETIVELAAGIAEQAHARDRLRIVRIDPAESGYVTALAESVRRAYLDDPFDHLVVSFHGVPRRYDRREGGRYSADCAATFAALLACAGVNARDATLSFQSRFGPEPWTSPATFDTLCALARSGRRNVVVTMPGFLTEGLETLEEIGVRGRRTFLEAGGLRFRALPALEAAGGLIESIAASIEALPRRAAEEGSHVS